MGFDEARAGKNADAELALTFCSDRTIRALNREYRGIDKPTDVLSFPQLSPREGRALLQRATTGHGAANAPDRDDTPPVLLGDIAISTDTAKKYARLDKITTEEMIGRLIVHGIVHLLGYDHEQSRAEEKLMKTIEKRVLSAGRKKS